MTAETAALGPVRAALVTALIAVGGFFLVVGTIGLLRFPDVYNRLHATSKATTLGAASMFLAGLVYFGPAGAGLTSLIGIIFLFVTAPTGGHMISRSAQRMGVPFYGGARWPRADDRPASETGGEEPPTDD
ncbi:MAG: monovalent cation/H(+) antiporter subunit G [Halobacteriaceae archaeon]